MTSFKFLNKKLARFTISFMTQILTKMVFTFQSGKTNLFTVKDFSTFQSFLTFPTNTQYIGYNLTFTAFSFMTSLFTFVNFTIQHLTTNLLTAPRFRVVKLIASYTYLLFLTETREHIQLIARLTHSTMANILTLVLAIIRFVLIANLTTRIRLII